MRRVLSSLFRTISVVLLDKRKNVLRKGIMYRMRCAVCRGLSSNRSLCVHERVVFNSDQSSNEQRFENQRCEDDELYFLIRYERRKRNNKNESGFVYFDHSSFVLSMFNRRESNDEPLLRFVEQK